MKLMCLNTLGALIDKYKGFLNPPVSFQNPCCYNCITKSSGYIPDVDLKYP